MTANHHAGVIGEAREIIPASGQSDRFYRDDALLDQAQAEDFLSGQLKQRTLEDMRYRRVGPKFLKLGTGKRARVAYRVSDLRAWLDRQTIDPEAGR